TVRLWDATTGEEVFHLCGHLGPVTDVAFSPDGRRLASAGTDGSVRLWDTTSGQEVLNLRRPLMRTSSVAFSPDGRYLVAGEDRSLPFTPLSEIISASGSLKVWDATAPDPRPRSLAREALQADARDASRHRGNYLARLGRPGEAVV